MEYWSVETMEYGVRKAFKSYFYIIDLDALNPSFHHSFFPLFHF